MKPTSNLCDTCRAKSESFFAYSNVLSTADIKLLLHAVERKQKLNINFSFIFIKLEINKLTIKVGLKILKITVESFHFAQKVHYSVHNLVRLTSKQRRNA